MYEIVIWVHNPNMKEREREREVFSQVLKSDQVTFPSAIFLNKSVTISLIICIRPEVASLAEQPSNEFGFQ